jgi:hypothetical protein
MKLGRDLQVKLNKQYEPNSLISMKYKGNDIAFKTDVDGNPVLLFIGRKTNDDKIKGERYKRTLKIDLLGTIVKDHWELKGKAS